MRVSEEIAPEKEMEAECVLRVTAAHENDFESFMEMLPDPEDSLWSSFAQGDEEQRFGERRPSGKGSFVAALETKQDEKLRSLEIPDIHGSPEEHLCFADHDSETVMTLEPLICLDSSSSTPSHLPSERIRQADTFPSGRGAQSNIQEEFNNDVRFHDFESWKIVPQVEQAHPESSCVTQAIHGDVKEYQRGSLVRSKPMMALSPSLTFSSAYLTGEKRPGPALEAINSLKKSRSMFATSDRPSSVPFRKHASLDPSWKLQERNRTGFSPQMLSLDNPQLVDASGMDKLLSPRNVSRNDSGYLESVVHKFLAKGPEQREGGMYPQQESTSSPSERGSKTSLLSFLAGSYPHLAAKTGIQPVGDATTSMTATMKHSLTMENLSPRQRQWQASWKEPEGSALWNTKALSLQGQLERRSSKSAGGDMSSTLLNEVQRLSSQRQLKRSTAQPL